MELSLRVDALDNVLSIILPSVMADSHRLDGVKKNTSIIMVTFMSIVQVLFWAVNIVVGLITIYKYFKNR
jgi:hypothetical protein